MESYIKKFNEYYSDFSIDYEFTTNHRINSEVIKKFLDSNNIHYRYLNSDKTMGIIEFWLYLNEFEKDKFIYLQIYKNYTRTEVSTEITYMDGMTGIDGVPITGIKGLIKFISEKFPELVTNKVFKKINENKDLDLDEIIFTDLTKEKIIYYINKLLNFNGIAVTEENNNIVIYAYGNNSNKIIILDVYDYSTVDILFANGFNNKKPEYNIVDMRKFIEVLSKSIGDVINTNIFKQINESNQITFSKLSKSESIKIIKDLLNKSNIKNEFNEVTLVDHSRSSILIFDHNDIQKLKIEVGDHNTLVLRYYINGEFMVGRVDNIKDLIKLIARLLNYSINKSVMKQINN